MILVAVAAAPALASGANLPRASAAAALDLGLFSELLHQKFPAHVGEALPVELTLVAAEPRPAAHGEQFALVFRGPGGRRLAEATYWFEHERTGRFPMFIVPSGADSSGAARYVAVFNRLAGSAALKDEGMAGTIA